ncbi:MAG: heme-binding protein [Rhodoferax sp.]|nr:heme-binding protein [Rhodoferax sp.]MCB2036090.1 heme-binding protein [Ottowia sp.]
MQRHLISALVVLGFASAAQAQAVRTERNISLELAGQLAAASVAACAAEKYNVTAAVVDRAGTLRALMRADNAGPHTVAASQAKAFTAASARSATTAMLENVQKNPGAATLVDIPGFLVLGGGVPVKAGNDVIGAVGVAGAPGGHLDERCALAALDKVKDLLQ